MFHYLALKGDRSVWGWGTAWSGAEMSDPRIPGHIQGIKTATGIAAGDRHNLAVIALMAM